MAVEPIAAFLSRLMCCCHYINMLFVTDALYNVIGILALMKQC